MTGRGALLSLGDDARASLRALGRRPGTSLTAAVILTVGLSAAVAVFTYVNAFRHPFPGADASGLVQVFTATDDEPFRNVSYLDYLDYDAESGRAFQNLAAVQSGYAASVRLETLTEVAFLEAVSGDFFSVLGADMALGRGFTLDDDRPGAEAVAVISHDWWATTFGADSAAIGSVVQLNFRPHTIVGVANPDFHGSSAGYRPRVWIPFEPFRDRYTTWETIAQDRDRPALRLYGRLRSDASEDRATAELATVARGLDERYPPGVDGPRRVRAAPATWIDPAARLTEQPTTRLMMIAAAGLLLLVCANVTNLLLAVATGRTREMAVHSALGASPGRLARRILAENVLLAGVAGVVALVVASPLSARLGSYFARPSIWGENVSRETALDLRVILFALGLAVLTGLVAGGLPALCATRRDLVSTLKADSDRSVGARAPTTAGPKRWRGGAQDLLIGTQVALSVVLLLTAALVLRTLGAVSAVDPGFDYQSLVASHVSTSSTTIQIEERERFFEDLAARVAEQPWARAATVQDNAILSGQRVAPVEVEGQPDPVPVVASKVHPNYFATLGIDVLEGRGFLPVDSAGGLDVAVVNRSFVDRHFAGAPPLGQRVVWPAEGDAETRRLEVVGVVSDARVREFLSPPEPVLYLPYRQHPYGSGSALLVETQAEPESAVPRLQAWLREYEPHLAIVNVLPYTEVVRGFQYVQRMNAELFASLALLGLILAAVGIFGVMSLIVGRRTRELGIRMAMGAQRSDIGRLVLGRALFPVAVGLVVGLGGAMLLSKLVRSLLFGVETTDPLAAVASIGVLVLAALAATAWPTRRAVSVQPVAALRWRG